MDMRRSLEQLNTDPSFPSPIISSIPLLSLKIGNEVPLSKEEGIDQNIAIADVRQTMNPFTGSPMSTQTTSTSTSATQVRFFPEPNKRFKPDLIPSPLSRSIQDDPFSQPNYPLPTNPPYNEYAEAWQLHQQQTLWNTMHPNPFQSIAQPLTQGFPMAFPPTFFEPSVDKEELSSDFSQIESSIREDSDDSPVDDPITSHDGLFMLREQPKPKQRKSYKKENRYLLPNPTQIIPGEHLKKKSPGPSDKIESGTCKVTLVDGAGSKLMKETSFYLEDTEGPLVKPFDKEQGCFNFTLKIRQNSGPDKFRLKFRVKYKTADGVEHKENIISNAFLVQSNKSFFSKDPKLKGIHPAVGVHDKPNEVWIKGRDFNEKGVVVKIDGIDANVIEIQPNLIIALTPVREEITKTKVVKVTVSNLFKQKMVHSEQHFQFTYLAPSNDGKVSREHVFKRSGSPLVASKENSS